MGNGLRQLLQPALFKKGEFHFWVLSTPMKKLACQILGLPKNTRYVSVIPRYVLFPQKEPAYSLKESTSFVYSGRNSLGKNLDTLVRLVELLRKEKFKNHKLHIFHPKFAKIDKNFPPWVKIHGDHGSEWLKKVKGRPVFISLSHYALEDFSVAAAEAQSVGMPIIVPNWFCFQDVLGPGVVKLTATPQILQFNFDDTSTLKKWVKEIGNPVYLDNIPTFSKKLFKFTFLPALELRKRIVKCHSSFAVQISIFFSTPRRYRRINGLRQILTQLALDRRGNCISISRINKPPKLSENLRILNNRWFRTSFVVRKSDSREIFLLKENDKTICRLDGFIADLVDALDGSSPLINYIHVLDEGFSNDAAELTRFLPIIRTLESIQGISRRRKVSASHLNQSL